MALLLLKFSAAAVVVLVAGVFLTRYADALGDKLRLGRSLAGLLLLASATSLPEIVVDCSAARLGAADLALGDLLGSSLMNLLILAVLDLVRQSPARVFSPATAAHAISASMSIALTAICLVAVLARLPGELAGVGPGPWAIGVAYLLGLRLVFLDQQFAQSQLPAAAAPAPPSLSWLHAGTGFALATGVIFFAAPFLAHTADELARRTGLGGTFVGSTLVALSTSLPELVTTLTALRLGATDLAVGNIFGSNSFNMLIIPLVDLAYEGSLLTAVSANHALTAGCVVLVTSAALVSLLYRAEKRWWLIEPDAALVILLVLAALGLLYIRR
jgi:cation:H+ antiporter